MTARYRVIFLNQGAVYEMYAENIADDSLFGFLEVGPIVFGNQTTMVVDPSEERLKAEFAGVERFFVPMHHIIRIDEVSEQGPSKVRDAKDAGNITPFPGPFFSPPGGKG